MTELLTRITRPIIENTPRLVRDRVADALLRLPELRLAQDKNSDSGLLRTHAKWYERDRDTSAYRDSNMGVNERIWFLLEADSEARDQWVSLITSNDSNYELEGLYKVSYKKLAHARILLKIIFSKVYIKNNKILKEF